MTTTETRPPTWDHLRSKKKPRTKTVPIAMDPELAEDLEDVRSRVDVLKIRTSARPEDQEAAAELATQQAKLDQILEQSREDIVVFKFRSIGRKKFEKVVVANLLTDEKKKKYEEERGTAPNSAWDPETFEPALVAECLVYPQMSEEEVLELYNDDNWSASEWYVMFTAALDVNSNHRNANLGKG